jgi:hypothetical protein
MPRINMSKHKKFGTFKCSTAVLRVADGCYSPDTWCLGFLTKVKLGKFLAFKEMAEVKGWGTRVKRILIIHEDLFMEMTKKNAKTLILDQRLEDTIGVDAGMAGFMDAGYLTHEDELYDKICDGICGNRQSYSDNSCAITSSGFGDGSYRCHYKMDKHRVSGESVVAACITFI